MNTMRTCEQCRQPLPGNAPEGLCPACLAKVALGTETAALSATINVNPLAETAPGPRVPPKPADLAPQFPQLEILELLGMGGMGMVYKARQPKLDRFVALKILPLESAQHPYFAERFNREAKALAKLNHPGIVDVYDFGQTGQYYYFVMEYVDGMNLRQLLKTQTLESRQALELVTQICTALQYAHDEGVVHRDIKPENILINKKGQVKIADFGLAKLLGAAPDTALTMSQAAMGTFNYMAPEQRENAQKVDHRADIYSLGVVLYEMLTGEVPMGRFEAPSKRVQVDVRLDEVVLKALEREPARRYQQASEVKSNVEAITSTPSASAIPPVRSASPQIPESLLARDYRLEIGSCLRRGWGLVKSDFWPTVGVTLLVLALMETACIMLANLGEAVKGTEFGFSVIQCLITGPMLGGLSFYFLGKIRRERATVETAFVGFSKRFLHSFLANLVTAVLVGCGIMLFIVPGIYLLVAWVFTQTLVIDQGLDFWTAMAVSRKIIHKHWWKMLLFLIVLGALWLVGLLCLGIGIFVAVPISIAAFMYAYEDIFGTWSSVKAAAGKPTALAPGAHDPASAAGLPTASGVPPPVAVKPDLFWRRLVLVILGLVAIPIALSLLAIFMAMLLPALGRAKLKAHHIAAQNGNQEGWQLMNEGKLEDARKKFTQVVAELDPASVDGWNGLGWTWFRAGQTQAAETNFQKALSFNTNCPGALNGLGQIYFLRKNYDLAEQDLLQAAPKESAAWHGLARLYLLEGKFDRATEWAQKLVDSEPADDTARQMLQAAREKHVSDELRQVLEAPPNSDKTSAKPMPEKLSP